MNHLLNALHIGTTNEWLIGLLKSLSIILVYFIFIFVNDSIISRVIRRVLQRTHIPSDQSVLNPIDRLVRRIALIATISIVAESFPISGKIQSVVLDALFVVMVYVVLTVSFEVFDVIGRQVARLGASEFLPLLSKLFRTVGALVAIMVVMRHFNYDIWHIMTALGIGSLAVGLAAQTTLANMIAGFTLLIDRPFKPSDRILLGGGNEGDILQIGMRSTRIQTTEGNVLIVPNSELVNSRLVNYNYPDTRLFQKVKFQFAFENDFRLIKQLLKENALKVEEVLAETVKVHLSSVLDGRIEVTVNYYVRHFSEANIATDKIIDGSLGVLKEKGIKLASLSIIHLPAREPQTTV